MSAAATKDPRLDEVLQSCRKMIRIGSKSFSAASTLFGKNEKDAAVFLYAWCRFCDDQIDEAKGQGDEKLLIERLAWLRVETKRAIDGEDSNQPVFIALAYVLKRFQIPAHYPLELLAGMEMDIHRTRYPDFDSLKLYCYRVAGVVGLMMSHIIGVSDPRSLKHACDMGIAMQLTNIARDVFEDAAMARVYLPLDWLKAVDVSPDSIWDLTKRGRVAMVVRRLLAEADSYYDSGSEGLKYLSFRPACAVAAAQAVYSEIGVKVLRRGEKAWDDRVWIGPIRKGWVMLRALLKVIATLPYRVRSPWRREAITLVWRQA